MDLKQLGKLLKKDEGLKLEFKEEIDLSTKQGKGEFYKDIISVANGNTNTAHQPGYLIIGAKNKLKEDNLRELKDIGNLEISKVAIVNALRDTFYPGFQDLDCEKIEIYGVNLVVITIPPCDDIYTLAKDLKTKTGTFKEGTTFLRYIKGKDDAEIREASPQETIRIRREKANRHQTQKSDLYEKLTNPTFIVEEISSGRLLELIDAYSNNLSNPILSSPLDQSETLCLIQATFRLAEAALERDIRQLSSQLIGRLLFIKNPGIQEFLDKIRQYQDDQERPWLEPVSSSLKSPIAFLIRDNLKEHKEPITVLAVDKDSSKLVSASRDGQLNLWDLEHLEQNQIPHFSAQKHREEVNKIIITGDQNNQKIISASKDGTVKVWDPNQKNLLFDFQEHEELISSIALTPDNQKLISVSDDCKLRIWSLIASNEDPLIYEREFDDLGEDIFITLDGQYAYFSTDCFINIWNLTDNVTRPIPVHEQRINSLYFSQEHKKIVSVSDDKTLKIWDDEALKAFTDGQPASPLAVQNGCQIWSHLSITPDGKSIIFVDYYDDKNVVIWDWEDDKIHVLENRHKDTINALAMVPHRAWLITGSDDETVQAWDLSHRQWLDEIKKYKNDKPTALTVTPNGQYLFTALDDKSLEIWNFLDDEASSIDRHTKKIKFTEYIPGIKCLLSISEDQSLKIWQVNDGSLLKTLNSDDWISAYAVDQQRLVFASGNQGNVIMQNLSEPDEIQIKLSEAEDSHYIKHSKEVNAIILTAGGSYAISASNDEPDAIDAYNLIIWDLENAKNHKPLKGHRFAVSSITISADKKILVSDSADKTILWNLETFKLLYIFNKNSNLEKQIVTHIDISPKIRFLIYETDSSDLEIWDLSNGTLFFILPDQKDKIAAIAITEDGEKIITTSNENYLEFWDIHVWSPQEDGTKKSSYSSKPEHSHAKSINSLAITHDNRYVISVSDDATVKAWKIQDGSLIATFTGESEMTTCSVSSDDLTIIAGERSGRLHFLKLQGT